MGTVDIPRDKAELLSIVLEAIVYGFSLLMFGGTIWTLVLQRSTERVNRKMFAVACALLLFSTVHFVFGIIRIVDGLILYRDSFLGGPIAYFSTVTQWTFVCKNVSFSIQALLGDSVLLYRCYVAWQSKLVMILPVLLWCAVAVTGLRTPFTSLEVAEYGVSSGHITQWMAGFYASTLSSNLLTTFLLAYRIWYVDHKTARLLQHRKSQLRPVLHIIIDAGVIYSFTLFTGLICFLNSSNGQYVVLSMGTPIISISFYMVIIRVGLASSRAKQATNMFPLQYPTTSNSFSNDQRNGMRIQIVTSTERKVDNGQCMTPMGSENDWTKPKSDVDDVEGAVQPEL